MTPSMKAIGKVIFAIFLSYQAASVLANLIPPESYLSRRIAPAFRWYRAVTGGDQYWDLFTTAPIEAEAEIRIHAFAKSQKMTPLGPIVPGLIENESRTFRYRTGLMRFFAPRFSAFMQPYGDRVADELRRLHQEEFRSFKIVARSEIIAPLEEIRSGGPMTRLQPQSRGPWTLGE